jgi:putative serine protease PepD
VIESAATSGKITVEFSSGDQIDAKIVGRDKAYDVAVLQINRGNLAALNLGDSTKLTVGEPVMAVGSPLGLASTVTTGIISALNRPVSAGSVGAESFVNAIQTDAAINPGNSGGALINAQGQIIGVNSAIATLSSGGTSGSIGLGFAIPITEAKRVIDEIITSPTNTSTRPLLGVFFDNTYEGIGAKILRLSPSEAAELAGIPAGSVIKSIGGQRITDQVSAIVRIRSFAPGATISVTVELPNSGGVKTFTVKLGKAPSNG